MFVKKRQPKTIQRLLILYSNHQTISRCRLGQPGVDIHLESPNKVPVVQLAFMINNGGLVAAMADDTLALWNLRQKTPEIANSLAFQRERVTCVNLPTTSRYAYVGTDRGNVYVVNVSTFELSGYVVNWNKAIEV